MMMITLDLTEDFHEALKLVKKRMDALKNSIEPYGMHYFIKISLYLPSILAKVASNYLCDKMSLVFSNVPGPRTPYKIQGK